MNITIHNRFVETIMGKIIIAFVLVLFSISLIWFVNRVAFKKITSIVNELSLPNDKLLLSRKLFIDVSNLTHLQRLEVMEGKSRPSQLFIEETKKIEKNVTTLKNLMSDQPAQTVRIDSITLLMRLGNKLFLEHLKLRFSITHIKEFESQIGELSDRMDSEQVQVDKNIVTREKKIKITTVLPIEAVQQQPAQKKSWLKKIFSKKKIDTFISTVPLLQPQVTIEEQTNTTIDTLTKAKRDTTIANMGNSLKKIESKRVVKNNLLKKSEQQLLLANEVLLNQLINILSEVEKEETGQVREKTNSTVVLADGTIGLTKTITIILLITALILGTLILADITRSRTYRRQLEIAKSDAEYHSLAKQRFLANMSHEIRTPLQSIIGYSELELNLQQPVSKNISAIYKSSRHLLQIVNEILDYSRIISGKFTFESKPFSITEIVAEVTSGMQPEAQKKSLQLQLTTLESNDAMQVKGDAFRLKQVLFNLLGNAIKFTEKGTIQLTVQQSKEGEKVHCMFVITDTGIGMDAKDLQTIFNQFEQAENTASLQNGTGLGLSIVKELVQAQQGSITVQSSIGKGSTFTVMIPYLADTAVVIAAPKKINNPLPFTEKVWLVDDDALILTLSAAILQKQHIGHKAFDTAEKLLAEPWDDTVKIIFTDLRLPGIGGIRLCRQLRTILPATVKIIALTAQALPEEKEALLINGFDGLLLKPFTENELISMVYAQATTTMPTHTINLDKLKIMIGDKDELLSILQQCYDDTTNDMLELLSLQKFDPNTASLIIHRLAGRIGQMGDKIAAAYLRKSEVAAWESANEKTLKDKTSSLIPVIQSFLKALQDEINKMEKVGAG